MKSILTKVKHFGWQGANFDLISKIYVRNSWHVEMLKVGLFVMDMCLEIVSYAVFL